ncbi:hypothetical protein PG994_014887 [Apiospora phragmitis]|uniref:Uncharacterized protein n=1 Tax=Apiospora phragmitis TaxID=2905665 RepID=A0ABR1SWQ6_9PEZI
MDMQSSRGKYMPQQYPEYHVSSRSWRAPHCAARHYQRAPIPGQQQQIHTYCKDVRLNGCVASEKQQPANSEARLWLQWPWPGPLGPSAGSDDLASSSSISGDYGLVVTPGKVQKADGLVVSQTVEVGGVPFKVSGGDLTVSR